MKYTINHIPGESRTNERYTVNDNTELTNLVISNVHLYRNQETLGHFHVNQDEVYFFVSGQGSMLIDEVTHQVSAGDVVLVPHSKFHKVYNTGICALIFNTVYNRKNHEAK
jgi:oxalate decarboxylase/phosphoglucose isomerase-like protein (cupin superfamily)